MIQLKASGLSDVGQTRNHNEDSFDVDPALGLFVVADGMGGHSHGEVASRVAVDAIRQFVEQTADGEMTWPFPYDPRLQRHSNRLKAAIQSAHDKVMREILRDGSLVGMGTTVVGILVEGSVLAIAHVGDSRGYRWRDGALELLTQDHTWVNEQVVAGYLSEEQARSHPLKNVVTRALGGESDVLVDVKEFDIAPGDLYLLCSDGLTNMLTDEEIAEHLDSGASTKEACHALITHANARGGLDNVTAVLLQAEEK